jgi:hypothetical protein
VFAALWLALFDQLVPGLLHRAERERYEAGGVFRFESSDLFALGPLVSYLREHPHGDRRRVAFLGNSFVFGYGLTAEEAIPARFQRHRPDVRVFNVAFNSAELGSSYLIAKAIGDAVDCLFVLDRPQETAHDLLPSLIPVEEGDLRAFALAPPDRVERRLEAVAGVWRLFASRYRLQSALLSTSTRQYLYLHKRDIARRLLAPIHSSPARPPAAWRPSHEGVRLRVPRSAASPDAEGRRRLRERHQLLCRLADLARTHRKRTVFLRVDRVSYDLSDAEVADFNATFAPFGEVVILQVPPSLTYDGMHLTPQGAEAVATALSRYYGGRESERR